MSVSIEQKNLPSVSGIYIFSKKRVPIYIGKAANLKKRVVSYWRKNSSEKVRLMMQDATKLEWIETESEIEALLKEAKLIKKYYPKYNILMRDDKNYFYVGFTNPNFLKKISDRQALEKFPRIFVTHQPVNINSKFEYQNSKQIRNPKIPNSKRLNSISNFGFRVSDFPHYVGPFTSGTALYSTLRLLRRIFPYCTCARPHKRPCLNTEIGRCPGYCCLQSQINMQLLNVHLKERSRDKMNILEYRENIKNIKAVLEGKRTRILSRLKQEMKLTAKKQEFEKAAKLRDQIWGLENIFSHRRMLEVEPPRGGSTSKRWRKMEKIIRRLLGISRKISRVEGYDISNISGHDATGSMTVFINGHPAKSEYRKFRIKTVSGANDIAMHKEVLQRRLKHPEWKYPDLMVIDGGRAQLNAAKIALSNFQFSIFNFQTNPKPQISKIQTIRITSLAKREEELYTENRHSPIPLKTLSPSVMHFFQHVRDESHRFAKKYHHKLREIKYREKIV